MVEEIDVSEYSGIHSKYAKPTDIYLTLKTMLFLLATWVLLSRQIPKMKIWLSGTSSRNNICENAELFHQLSSNAH